MNNAMKRRVSMAIGMLMLMVPQTAFAGTSGSTMGSGLIGMLNEVIEFLTGPLVLAVGTLAFLAAMIMAYFSGGQDAAKKVLGVGAITALIIGGPAIMLRVSNAAGALV